MDVRELTLREDRLLTLFLLLPEVHRCLTHCLLDLADLLAQSCRADLLEEARQDLLAGPGVLHQRVMRADRLDDGATLTSRASLQVEDNPGVAAAVKLATEALH